jgi:hypothetical protein
MVPDASKQTSPANKAVDKNRINHERLFTGPRIRRAGFHR